MLLGRLEFSHPEKLSYYKKMFDLLILGMRNSSFFVQCIRPLRLGGGFCTFRNGLDFRMLTLFTIYRSAFSSIAPGKRNMHIH